MGARLLVSQSGTLALDARMGVPVPIQTMKTILAILLIAATANATDLASWYYPRTNGMFCATRFYPIGTKLRVTEIHNGISVVVVVIERGPAFRLIRQHRVIDLAPAAFQRLAGLELGLAEVTIVEVK